MDIVLTPSRAGAALALLLLPLAVGCGSADAERSQRQPGATYLGVVGDFGTGGRKEQAVADALAQRAEDDRLDALLTTGDNVYPDGSPSKFDQAWNEPYGWVEDQDVKVVAALGNHDVRNGNGPGVQKLLGMPGPWYSTTVGLVQVVVLDTNDIDEEQTRFLARTLDEPLPEGTRYRVVVFHEPALSCAREPDDDVVEEWVPLLTDGDVDLVLNGHNHLYERFSPEQGPPYVVTGGGGAELYPVGRCASGTPEAEVAESVLHYVTLVATEEKLQLQAVEPDGDVIDELELEPDR